MLITGAIFIGLLLNIIAVSVKKRTLVYNIMIVTYFFEVASVIALAFLIYMP
jgi:UDP-N-acetylmuramyl pentapeptide phosphotransferase/UDP-N-acetylglucosamine-1-phosphate transferase